MTLDFAEGWETNERIMLVDDARPILAAWVDAAIDEIEYQTGVRYSTEDFESRLYDKEWIFGINNNDEPDEINMESAGQAIEDLMYKVIREIQDEQEEPDVIQTAQGFAPNYNKFEAMGMTTEEALVWCNMD